MQSFPQPLSVEEENEAIERWEQGDREARNILIERNLRLVAYLVKKYGVMQAPTLIVVEDGKVQKLANASNIKKFTEENE